MVYGDMDANEKTLLQHMVETIVREVAPETIILFGSRARGDARPDSDVDLLVVEAEPFSPPRSRREEAARLYMALRGMEISKNILLYSRVEFDHRKNSLNHVSSRAHREGRLLYCMAESKHARTILCLAHKDFSKLTCMLDNTLFATTHWHL